MQTKKLKVGLVLDGMQVDAWKSRLIEMLMASDYAAIALVVLNQRPAENPWRALAAKIVAGDVLGAALRRALTLAEQLVVGRPGVLPNAFRRVDASRLLQGVETLHVTLRREADGDAIDEAGVAAVRARELDVLLRLGSRTLRGGILRSARYGVWSLQHGDDGMHRGGPAGYWEVMQSRPETGSLLQILSEDAQAGTVLYRSVSATRPMSMFDNRSNCYWKSLYFVARKLKELHEVGEREFFARVDTNVRLHLQDRPLHPAPTNGERAALVCRKVVERVARRWYEARYFDQWCLLYDLGGDVSTALWRFKPLVPPKDRFWADPFVVARDGKFHIFVEEFVYRENKGHISVLTLGPDGRAEPPVTVLEAPHHLSYPFVFPFEGELYMLPESSANRTLGLYKCVEFPGRWEFQQNLMEGARIADATLVEWRGRWWLFANMAEYDESANWDELYVFYADSPLSTRWTPHPSNPVVSDARRARPAGRIFERGGRLYRPSQNCSRHYGYGFNLCEIRRLTETHYEETVACAVEPKWRPDIVSTHTFNYDQGLTVVDCQMRRSRWAWA